MDTKTCQIPTLETERLSLGSFYWEDMPRLVELIGNDAIWDTTLNIPRHYSMEDAKKWFELHESQYLDGTAFRFAIRKRGEKVLVGCIGLRVEKAHSKAEVGYWTGQPYWGNGYMSEALRRVISYGFEDLGLNLVFASHFTRNPASGKVMQKAGMVKEGEMRGYYRKEERYEDVCYYGITASRYYEPKNAKHEDQPS